MKNNLIKRHWIPALKTTIFLVLLFCAFSLDAHAGTYGDFTFTQDNSSKEIKLTEYSGSGSVITIPSFINGYPVTSTGQDIFENNKEVETVIFESNSQMRSFGYGTFKGCSNLKNIDLPESLTTFGGYTFSKCTSLERITIPKGVIVLGSTSMPYYAWSNNEFEGCTSLKEVHLPETMTTLGYGSFDGCTSLKEIILPKGLTEINLYCFRNTGLTNISIPEGVTEIDTCTFSGCTSLTDVSLSENVTTFDSYAFYGCTSLETMNIPEGLRRIEDSCFANCSSLTSLKFGEDVTTIGSNVFSNCPKLKVSLVRGTKLETYCMNNDVPFESYATTLAGCSITGLEDKIYTGKVITQNPVVKNGTETLKENDDYIVHYSFNKDVGKATVTFQGIGNYLGTITKTFEITAADISKCKITLASTSLVYKAERLKPAVKVTFNGNTVNSIYDYKVSYNNNLYVGTATVTISGKRNFINSVTRTFTIVPKGIQIKKLKKGSKCFTATWGKNSIQTYGYQLEYALNKNFTSGKKSKTISNAYITTTKIKKLKSKKTYYVRIRTYKESKNKKYYSTWSTVKKVKTK